MQNLSLVHLQKRACHFNCHLMLSLIQERVQTFTQHCSLLIRCYICVSWSQRWNGYWLSSCSITKWHATHCHKELKACLQLHLALEHQAYWGQEGRGRLVPPLEASVAASRALVADSAAQNLLTLLDRWHKEIRHRSTTRSYSRDELRLW